MTGSFVKKVMENIPEDKPVTMHQLSYISGIDYRTIKGCIDVIMEIQSSRKIVKDHVGLRVVVKKEK